ncbi:MAG: hypothetical protein ACKVJF_07165 [Flavobacteriales bacterium]
MGISTFLIILVAAITATSTMTLFSQLVSKFRNNEFNEAKLLSKFIVRTKSIPKLHKYNTFWGWIIHYAIGVMIAAAMYFVFWNFNLDTTAIYGGLFGLIAGFMGAIGWLGLFTFHSNPPHTDVKEFLIQLVVAHIIFGASVSIVFQLLQ